MLERAETTLRGSALFAHVEFAGAITGTVGITMALVMIGAATSVGAAAEPLVSRAVSTASAEPYLVAAMGFAALLGASGLLTLQTGALRALEREVALIGSGAFLVTFMTTSRGPAKTAWPGTGFSPASWRSPPGRLPPASRRIPVMSTRQGG